MQKITKLIRHLKKKENRFFLLQSGLKIINIHIEDFYLMVQPIPQKSVVKQRKNKIKITLIEPEQYNYGWFPSRKKEFIKLRFEQGSKCWVAFKEERAIGCIWIMPGSFKEDIARIRLIPLPEGQTAWDFDIYIDESFRMGRLFGQLWNVASIWMREQGFYWTASRIDCNNEASLRAHKRLGAKSSGHIQIYKWGWIELVRINQKMQFNLSRHHWIDISIPLPEELKKMDDSSMK